MIYGLYLSATGVLTNSYRQDVIANNLANAETVGFKRSLALFQQRRTEAQTLGQRDWSDPLLEGIGGGILAAPTWVDQTQGELEETGNNLDVAIHGRGFLAVKDARNQTHLTRDGRLLIDRAGFLVQAGTGQRVLDDRKRPISLSGLPANSLSINGDGTICTNGTAVARIGLVDVSDPSGLVKIGSTLLAAPDGAALAPATGTLASGFVERANVDPTTELTQLIQTQRQLEANANMIRYQDQTLGRLVNDVGKIT